jgi:hypothetical protein
MCHAAKVFSSAKTNDVFVDWIWFDGTQSSPLMVACAGEVEKNVFWNRLYEN